MLRAKIDLNSAKRGFLLSTRACVSDICGHSGAPQRRAAPRRGGEDAPVVTAGSDAHEAAVRSGISPACPVTRLPARAVGAERRSRAAALERAAGASAGFEASERDLPLRVRLEADARDPTPRAIRGEIGAIGEESPCDLPLRVMARLFLLGPPRKPRAEQRSDLPLVPQQRLPGANVDTAVVAEAGIIGAFPNSSSNTPGSTLASEFDARVTSCCTPRYFVADFSGCFGPVDARFVTLLRHRRRTGRGRVARGGARRGDSDRGDHRV